MSNANYMKSYKEKNRKFIREYNRVWMNNYRNGNATRKGIPDEVINERKRIITKRKADKEKKQQDFLNKIKADIKKYTPLRYTQKEIGYMNGISGAYIGIFQREMDVIKPLLRIEKQCSICKKTFYGRSVYCSRKCNGLAIRQRTENQTHKKCAHCKVTFSVEDFWKKKSNGRMIADSLCKTCRKKSCYEWRKKNPLRAKIIQDRAVRKYWKKKAVDK